MHTLNHKDTKLSPDKQDERETKLSRENEVSAKSQ